ncbi:Cullin binding-domain-containing protein [Scheffersomyces amazonensis]|uniref:Cullin binding-domain-containing protein n=1 Tax=Scheffersomyces amazonensis TaxID=1078765 RepID=UPI00315DFE6F
MPRISKQAQLQQQFVDTTQSTLLIAETYLKKFHNNIDEAVEQYYKDSEKDSEYDISKFDKKLLKLYQIYQDPSDYGKINIEGTMKYLQDLGIEPEDLESLTLAYLLDSNKIGIFEQVNFLKFWSHYKINDIKKMYSFIKKIHQQIINQDITKVWLIKKNEEEEINFKDVYEYTFSGLLEGDNQNKLDYELSIDYWKLLIPVLINKHNQKFNKSIKDQINIRLNQWYEFLENDYKQSISRDKWNMFYLFVQDIIIPDPINLSEYDEMAAWPTIMDEYILYLRDNELLK